MAKNIRVERGNRSLPCQLTDEEIQYCGQDLAKAVANIEEVEARREEANKGFKAEAKVYQEEIDKLQRMINAGSEDRVVDVEISRDFDKLHLAVKRLDTGEIVEDREMTQDERQLALVE